MQDLFATDSATDNLLQTHELGRGALVDYAGTTPLSERADALFAALMNEVAWEQREIVIGGRSIPQPRLVSWMGEPGLSYTYSGLTLSPSPWTPAVLDIKDVVQEITGHRFNTVLANLYRNGRDSMGFHSDDERELGKHPVIASVSLGATRRFVLRSLNQRPKRIVSFDLVPGSLLVMRGTTQELFEHGMPKVDESVGPRINLTFRTIV